MFSLYWGLCICQQGVNCHQTLLDLKLKVFGGLVMILEVVINEWCLRVETNHSRRR